MSYINMKCIYLICCINNCLILIYTIYYILASLKELVICMLQHI